VAPWPTLHRPVATHLHAVLIAVNDVRKFPRLMYDGTALDAARFYAKTFPDSAVGTVIHAPGDFPDGQQGDVLLERSH